MAFQRPPGPAYFYLTSQAIPSKEAAAHHQTEIGLGGEINSPAYAAEPCHAA
jgi:hypothetical protein